MGPPVLAHHPRDSGAHHLLGHCRFHDEPPPICLGHFQLTLLLIGHMVLKSSKSRTSFLIYVSET